MAASISLFPTLNDELFGKIRYQVSQYEFYYIREEQENFLRTEEIENGSMINKLMDDEGIWSPDEYNLCIRRKYSLRTYQCLFGENGIACSNAILGLALMWTSSDSKQRGVVPIGDISNSLKDLELILDYEFIQAQLRGLVEFTTIVYIKNVGTPSWEEEHLANEYGCILGELDKFIIKLDGTGSVFPMYEVNEIGQPLWYVKCDWDDPTYEQFSECISININTAHKNYKYLDKKKRTFNEQLLKEIIASALVLIITKLKGQEDYWDETMSGNNLETGSVSEAIYYFVNTLEWDVSTPETISLSIRKFFDQRM
ncbi:MAG TPA: hypothetical protein IAC14_10715 [Candidatus Scybalomonas excrementigallinarum]|nr:hypothetical protein [Candidatus Scybalomonas excrementigallinarum]